MNSRNLKVFILVTILLVSIMNGFSFATSSAYEEATQLGIIDDQMIKSAEISQNTELTRYQVAFIYLNVLGLQETIISEDYTAINNFQDTKSLNEDKLKMLLFIKKHPELGWIGNNNQFSPLEQVTQQQYLKVLLSLLGYQYGVDYQWNGIDELSRAIGFAYTRTMNQTLKLEDVLQLTLMALKINTKDGIKLYDVLVKTGNLGADQLLRLGILEDNKLTINAIQIENTQTFKVEFGDKIDALRSENISVYVGSELKKNGAIQLSKDGYSALLTIENLNYEDFVSFQFINVLSPQGFLNSEQVIVKIPSFEDTYQVKLVCSDAENTVRCDGVSTTDIFVQVIKQSDGTAVPLDGLAHVTSTKGLLIQNEVVLKNGQGLFKITAPIDDDLVVSSVEVSLQNIPENREFEGLSNQIEINFTPEALMQKKVFVTPIAVYANEVDQVGVSFSGDVDVNDFKEQMIESVNRKMNEGWADFVASGNATIVIDDHIIRILDVLQQSRDTLEFVIDTEYYTKDSVYRSINTAPQLNILEMKQGVGDANVLKDNAKHVFSLSGNVGSLVVTDFSNQEFYVNDSALVEIKDVKIINDQLFELICSKNLSETIVEGVRNNNGIIPSLVGLNSHFTIDGKKVFLINDIKGVATPAELLFAKQNNLILLKELYVGSYDSEKSKDDRNRIYFELVPSEMLSVGKHAMTVNNIGDFASVSDRRNILTTKTIEFSVFYDLIAPSAQVKMMSPEQWLITFSEIVSCKDDWIEISLGNNSKTILEQDLDYRLTTLSNSDSENTKVLIELIKDWSVIYDEQGLKTNYWDSKNNPYQVKLKGLCLQDLWGNQPVDTQLAVYLSQDLLAPVPLEIVDLYKSNQALAPGKEIKVTFNEPIQTDDTRITLTKGTKTVKGIVKKHLVNELDTSFILLPETQLESGEWMVHFENISDDVGNVMLTEGFALQVIQ